MAEGWVYCISNPSMPGLLKIGMTLRTPQERLKEANSSDTWRPPTIFIIEFAKKVRDPLQKERTIHKLLEQYDQRVNPKREFFEVNTATARLCFELMDGEWLAEEPGQAQSSVHAKQVKPVSSRVPKPAKKSFKDLPTVIRALPIRGLAEAEAECLLSIALDTHRIQLQINGITYPYQAFDTVDPRWLHQKTVDALIDGVKPIRTDTIDEAIMDLSHGSFLVLEVMM